MREVLGGRYEIIEKIGGGGMAIVYLAKDLFLDRQVAVKVLRDEYVEDPEFIRHFHKEAKAVAALNHLNIVNIYDFDANSNPIYLVMEYVEGKTLKEIIYEEGSLPWQQVVDIGIQIANGLAEAHRNHIVHKDVKSHNILVDKNGMVKITDFGIAQMLSSTTITHNKGILGSAHYFSPEQARGERIDEKTDTYSLGVVLYEILTGQVPFSGDNPVTVALKHIQEQAVPPSQLVGNIPPELEAIVMRCLSKDGNARFANIGDVAIALEGVSGNVYKGSTGYFPTPTAIPPEAISKRPGDDTLALPRDLTQKTVLDEKEKKKNQKKEKRKNRLARFILFLIILAVAFGTIKVAQSFMGGGEVEVPQVVDMTVPQAKALVEAKKLKLDSSEEAFSDTVEKGRIIKQSPEPGSRVKENRSIQVVVSKGTDQVPIPDLSGQTVDQAKKLLSEKNLKFGEQTNDYNDQYAAGQIFSQTPEKEKKVDKDTVVNVVVSLGAKPKLISVPDLRGQNLSSAKNILSNAGLSLVSQEEDESDTVPKGLVMSQSLEAGTQVQAGSGISVVISKGKAENKKADKNDGPSATQTVQFTVPSDGTVTIQQTDDNGSHLVYSGKYKSGDYFNQSFAYTGKGALRISLNGSVIQTIPLG